MSAFIRLATPADARALRAIYAPFCSADSFVSFEIEPPSIEEMQARIERTLSGLPWLVMESEGEAIGYVYAALHNPRAAYRWSVSTAVYVREDLRGRGVGKAMYVSLFNALRLQGFYNAFAGITLPNPGSVGLHRSLGFESVGVYRNVGYKAGGWRDVSWWGLALREPAADPLPTLSLEETLREPGWSKALASGLSAPD